MLLAERLKRRSFSIKRGPVALTAFILLVIFLSYSKVPFLFFQQDEILGFGMFIKEGKEIIHMGLWAGNIKHFVPLTMSLSYSLYSLFGMQYFAYNLVGLLFHLINGMLVYRIAKSIFKKQYSATIAALVFFSSSAAAELIMWPVINLNSISLTFSLILWLIVIEERILPKAKGFLRGLIISILFLFSILSVEYSLGLIIFVPVAVFLLKKVSIKEKIKYLLPFGAVVSGYSLFRAIPIISNQGLSLGIVDKTPFLLKIFNLVTRYVGQLFIGQNVALSISNTIGKMFGPMDKKEVFVENSIYPNVVGVVGIIVIILSYLLYRKLEKKNLSYSKHLIIIGVFTISASLPYLLIPGSTGVSSIISSRYLYFGLTGMALFIALLNDVFFGLKTKAISFVVLLLALFLVVSGTYGNYEKGNSLYTQGKLRLTILSLIKTNYDSLPEKVVFYIESDTSYYGLPDETKILPFQSGFGQTLLVFYSDKERLPIEFYPGKYLWEIDSQGYEEHEGRGFGYFRDTALLKEVVKEHDIPPESIIAFSWKHETQSLLDISDEVRQNISQ